MEFKDYYQILDLLKTASESEIKAAFRKLAKRYHPDLNPNNKEAEAKFKEMNEAYQVLSSPEKRKKYDQYGKDWEHADEFEKAKQQQQSRGRDTNRNEEFSGDFSDFFGSMFNEDGRSHSNHTKFRGQDIAAELSLDLIDAYKSHPKTLQVNGKSIRITIPAGVENGQIIKLKGYGRPGMNGGPSGDLFITFNIDEHPRYKRDGKNLYITEEIDLYKAILGGEITVETIEGKVKLKISPETQSGTKVKLKGKGFPVYKKEGEFGDLYISYQVKLPTNLSDKERELFKELSEIQHHGHK